MAQGHADDELIGKVLNGRFRVVARIGAGGMGRVYKAVQEPIDRMVALKVLNPRYDGAKDPGFERRFFLEASMTAKLKHPNTITVHDYGRTDDGIYYIAMEYLEGETLQAVLRRGPIVWSRALGIGSQIARSLREAHKQGMVHRDLKPANIMVLAEGTGGDVVKVLDFGLVKSFLAEKKKPSSSSDDEEDTDGEGSITKAGVLLGSPLYMAPEQARSDADGRTDIYALGTVLFQCMAGRTPFHGKESIDILVKQVREKPPELKMLVPSVPNEVHSLVMKCLEKAPENRFQSMDELLEAMRAVLSDQGLANAFGDPRGNTSAPDTGTLPSLVIIQQDPRSAASQTSVNIEAAASKPRLTQQVPSRIPKRIITAVVAIALLVGAGFYLAGQQRAAKPVALPMSAPVKVVRSQRPTPVVFVIDSEPSGAAVTRDGEPAGVTPMRFVMMREAGAVASAELTFELEGYEVATVVAQGTEENVPVRAVLKKSPSLETSPPPVPTVGKKPPPKQNPPGYKDDPYK